MDEIYRVGLEIVRQVQIICAAFDTPMQIFTLLGQSEFYFAFLPLIFWCLSREVGANLALLLLTSSYLNGLFKGTFQGTCASSIKLNQRKPLALTIWLWLERTGSR
jgi:hypothetical protein